MSLGPEQTASTFGGTPDRRTSQEFFSCFLLHCQMGLFKNFFLISQETMCGSMVSMSEYKEGLLVGGMHFTECHSSSFCTLSFNVGHIE